MTVVIKNIGAPRRIRTPDPQIRSLVLYPAELPVRIEACVTLLRTRRAFKPIVAAIASLFFHYGKRQADQRYAIGARHNNAQIFYSQESIGRQSVQSRSAGESDGS